jgi:hypothetical protein
VIGEILAGCVVAVGCQWLYLYWHVRNLPFSTDRLERVGYWEGQRRYWRTRSAQRVVVTTTCCAVGVLLGLSSLRTDPPGERWTDILLVIGAGAAVIMDLSWLIWKLRQPKSGQGSI